ncbi:AsmA-like C-terminal domain-containing protein [Arcobacter sp. CECT 8983]|uniref:YhdP family protein n=1 Tax=Arcobacter sp. CECT 8983 TaxID=2044508 RepID=UPI0013E8F820|nr:AsmA-like C-terminal domain-containing protein [Arcobacter sp. CECT 8983]
MYLKYDKKLILELDELVFDYVSSKKEVSVEDLKERFLQVPRILNYFEKIDIKKLKIKDNELTLLIDNQEFYLNNKDMNISANLKFVDDELHMQLYSFYVKSLNLTLFGESKIDASKGIINFFGYFNKDNIDGELNLNIKEDILDFYVNTTHSIKSIAFLKEMFRLDKVAEAWMYDNVEGDIDLNYLYGQVDLKNKEVILDSINGEAIITDAKIRFHKDAKTVNTPKLKVTYENDTLSFDLEKPMYGNSEIYGSEVYIPNLTSMQKGLVVVDLKTKSMLNDDILEILRAYKIKLPLKQLSGKADSSLILKIPYMASKKMDIDGKFILEDATLKLNDFEFYTKKADVVLKDNDVFINKSLVKHKDLIEGVLDLDIDTKNLIAKGQVDITSFNILADEKSLINLSGQKIPLIIDFKEKTKFFLDSLNSSILIDDELFSLKINDLGVLNPYSELLKELDVKVGDLEVNIKGEEDISFKTNLKELDFPFEKNGKKITELKANGIIKEDSTEIKTNNSDIDIIISKNELPLLKLDGIDLVITQEENSLQGKIPSLNIEMKNSKIKINKDTTYKVQWAKINLENKEIKFDAKVLELDLPFSKDGKIIKNLVLNGLYKDNVVKLNSKDKKLGIKYLLDEEKVFIDLTNYNLVYNTEEVNKEETISYYVKGKNSNIIVNKDYVIKAENYDFTFAEHSTNVELKYKDTSFLYNQDFNGNLRLEAKNMSDEFLNSLLNKDLISGGNVNISAYGKDKIVNGTAFIKESKIKDLAILNNLLIFINTSPGLINPLLAIPSVVGMATNGGFNINGYRVTDGRVDFTYNFDSKVLNMFKIFTKGNGIDFDGEATINFENSQIDSKLKLIFLKDYSKIVSEIPVFNYLFLGDEKRVDTQVEIYGTLQNPEYKTNLAKDGINAPVNFFKRLIQTPKKIYDSISE